MTNNFSRIVFLGFVALLICVALTASISAAFFYGSLKLSNALWPIPPDVEAVAPFAVDPFLVLGALVTGVIFGSAIGGFCAWKFLGWAKRRSFIDGRLT